MIILSTAQDKLTAVGLVDLRLSPAFSNSEKFLVVLDATYIPYAAVTPIRGAPLTCISLIAKQKSSSVFNSTILNSNGRSL